MQTIAPALTGLIMAAFATSAVAETDGDTEQNNIYMRDPTIHGPFTTSRECAVDEIRKLLGADAAITINGNTEAQLEEEADAAVDEDAIEVADIEGFSKDQSRAIFAYIYNGDVVELSVNFRGRNPDYFGWADMYYGERQTIIKLGGAAPLGREASVEVHDFIEKVDYRLRYCGGGAASLKPSFTFG